VEELLELVKGLQKKYHEEAVQIRIGRRKISPKDCVAASMTWLTKIGDIVIKFSPNPSGLAWSVIKALLQVPVTSAGETTAILASSARILGILGRGKAYEAVFKDDNTPLERLQTLEIGLVALYAKSLDLLAYAAQHFKNDYRKVLGWITDPGHAESNMAELIQCERDVVWAAECCEKARRTAADKGHTELLLSLRESTTHIFDDMRRVFDEMEAQEMLKALDYFSNVKFGEQHQKKAEARTPGTGQWLLQRCEFQDWDSTESSAILWLHGTVGMGKSFLASSVVDHFLNPHDAASKSAAPDAEDDQGFAFFYCERGSADLSEPISVLRSFVRQLSIVPCYPNLMQNKYIQLYREKRKQGSNLSIKECRDQLLVSANLYPRTTLILDGLDECNPEERWKLIDVLSELVNQAENSVKLFISSRREQDIAAHLDSHNVIEINAGDNWQDIANFVKQRIGETEKTGRWNSISKVLKDKVEKTVCEKSQGMFRWTYLQMDQLSKCRQEKQLEARLGKLPKTLNSTYDELFRGIQEGDREILERAVKWVMCTTSPFTTNQILDAVRLSIASDGTRLDWDPMITEATLLDICSHLIVKDSESGKWKFPHTSVIEYFEEVHLWNLEQSHSFVAKICLLYLLDDEKVDWMISKAYLDDIYLSTGELAQDYGIIHGFQQYVGLRWFRHISTLEKLESREAAVSNLLQQFLGTDQTPIQSSRHYRRWVELFFGGQENDTERDYSYEEGYHEFFPAECPLIGICILGFYHLLQDYWTSPIDVLPINKAKRDLLSIAAFHGHLEICERLIEHGANANRQIDDHPNDYSALSTAVRQEHVDIVRLLIDHGADPNLPNGANPNIGTDDERFDNLLLAAAVEKNRDMCRLLLEHGADVNAHAERGNYGSPLAAAAYNGDQDLCQLFLGHGADANASLDSGNYVTALVAAVVGGNKEVCRLLIE
ncbi:ankyrin, partial [Trichoderma citrinoviride]